MTARDGEEKSNLHGVPRTAASIKLLDGLLALTLPPLFDFSPDTPATDMGSSPSNLVFACFTLRRGPREREVGMGMEVEEEGSG